MAAQKPEPQKHGRFAACILLILLIFICYVLRLAQWQLIDGSEYEQLSLSNLTDTMELEAARGEIRDRDGNVLAGNRTSYDVIYNALYMDFTPGRRNTTILEVVDLLEEYNQPWVDRLPIELDENGEYQFKEDSESEIAALKGKDMLNLADYATAADCMNELASMYGCQGFSRRDTRTIASVRYNMTRSAFSRTNPYTIATDITPEMVGILSQVADQWPGIEVKVSVTRYSGVDGTLAPHVLGSVGQITQEQYEKAVEDGTAYSSQGDNPNISGYKWTDVMGQGGAEAAFESELRGKRGQQTIFTDENGDVASTALTVQPEEGHTVQLTLDSELQRVANLSLAKNIESNTEARSCIAGAVVAMDVKNFDVLACSSYPTYDLNRSLTDADYRAELNQDEERMPLLNRALDGTFTPGSVFKPLVAITGLQEGIFGANSSLYFCDRQFKYYDMVLGCTDYHGNANLYQAIAGSCNAYFCQAGLNIGIQKLDAYAEYFGLGEHTGVELFERTGIMSNPQEYMVQHSGFSWTDGITAQTAIGQADNMFTPMQLATYCATIANGGVRKQAHFLDKVLDYSGEEVIEDFVSPELFDAGISSDVMGVVWEAMRQVCTSGTARQVFSDYPVSVAAKTGTAETSSNPDEGGTQANLSFICFAPMEDPQIAIAVMLEYGNQGTYAQNIAKDLLDQYFGYYTWDEDGNRRNPEGKLVDEDGEVIEDDEEDGKAPADGIPSAPLGGDSSDEDGDEPQASPTPGRGSDIPDTVLGGEVSPAPDGSAAPDASPTPKPNNAPAGAPYYKGGQKKPSASSGGEGEGSSQLEGDGAEG